MEFRHQQLTRYILPLREGGSLPALAEADDGFRYVVKLKGSGHGPKVLVAEMIGALVAKALKFKVPEVVDLDLDEMFGRTEPDREVQDLLQKSIGQNLGMHFLSKAMTFDPAVNDIDELTASKIVWLDAFLTNVDRTRLNPNMMVRDGELWLIDFGASLYFHHSWRNVENAPLDPFPYIRTHVLLPKATKLDEADRLMRQAITPRTLSRIIDMVPEEWLEEGEGEATASERREVYRRFVTERLANSRLFVEQAKEERRKLGL
ncbi:MAG: aminotransferase class I and II [Muribaculaceae bacterium]|nr:aminotransferase class I and II [Muribaculaceae bacterium]